MLLVFLFYLVVCLSIAYFFVWLINLFSNNENKDIKEKTTFISYNNIINNNLFVDKDTLKDIIDKK